MSCVRCAPFVAHASDNPNTGSCTYKLALGCEGSDVIYLVRREFHLGQPVSKGKIAEFERAMRWAEADEISHDIQAHPVLGHGNRTVEFRFRWD
jgi:hypothetical protein